MARIEGFRIRNYGPLKDITMGALWNQQSAGLQSMTAVIGKNGSGKSTLFDAFGFLADCLKLGVEEACDARGRGGFQRLRSSGCDGPIEIEIYYRENSKSRPITYEVAINLDAEDRPYVSQERLRQRRKGQSRGWPFSFLLLENGKGAVWRGDAAGVASDADDIASLLTQADGEESNAREPVELADKRKLGIATLGAMTQNPRISTFRAFIEGWYLSYFTPDAARGLPLAGPQRHLNVHGDNVANVVQFMERQDPAKLRAILENIAKKIPGIEQISTQTTLDGRLALQFNDHGFTDPFYAQQMSDGTLKLFAYLLLLSDPEPPPFLCVEEPENGVYPKLLNTLADEFRHYADRRDGPQVFVTTHQPYFVDALEPAEVWIISKGEDGFSTVRRAADDLVVADLAKEGLSLGALWFSDYLDGNSDAL